MSGFRLTSQAARDLAGIGHHLLLDAGEETSRRVRRRLREEMARLGRTPGIGHSRPDLTERPLLFHTVYSYAIIYRANDEGIEVVRVLHHSRDLRGLLDR